MARARRFDIFRVDIFRVDFPRVDVSRVDVFRDADWRIRAGRGNSNRRARGGRVVSRSPTRAIDKETAPRQSLRIRQVMSILTGMECRPVIFFAAIE